MELHANIGDTIEVDATHLGEARRHGEIIEILGEGDTVHYSVRWADGHESLFFPGSSTHVIHHRQNTP